MESFTRSHRESSPGFTAQADLARPQCSARIFASLHTRAHMRAHTARDGPGPSLSRKGDRATGLFW
jgi:hypothetical protein